MSDLQSSAARGCQICGVLCDVLAGLKEFVTCEGIGPTDTINFRVPLDAVGYFHVSFFWQYQDSNGDVKHTNQTFQIGTSSTCK